MRVAGEMLEARSELKVCADSTNPWRKKQMAGHADEINKSINKNPTPPYQIRRITYSEY